MMALVDDVRKAGKFTKEGAEKKWLKNFSDKVEAPESAQAKTALVRMCVLAVHRLRHQALVDAAPRYGKVLKNPRKEPPKTKPPDNESSSST